MKTLKCTLLLCGLALASCKKSPASSDVKTNATEALPQSARCAQVSEVETVVVHETLLLKLGSSAVSGTYQFTTGERGQIQDAGFQHIFGQVAELNSENNIVQMKLTDGSLSVFFDEDFAQDKKLSALTLNFDEKKVAFTIEDDARETVVGSCIFE